MVKGANVIQARWKKWYPKQLAERERAFMAKLMPILWRVKMAVRCKKRQYAARRARLFCKDFMCPGALFGAIGHNFRTKVLRIQSTGREFLLMTRGRVKALERVWNEIGHKVR
jgi:hypothetical protein